MSLVRFISIIVVRKGKNMTEKGRSVKTASNFCILKIFLKKGGILFFMYNIYNINWYNQYTI